MLLLLSFAADVCPELQPPVNGKLDLPSRTFGSLATYSCDAGFVLFGNSVRGCLAGGIWSGEDPVCGRESNGSYRADSTKT